MNWVGVFALVVGASCTSLGNPIGLDPALGGTWEYVGGQPTEDPLIAWDQWTDRQIVIDSTSGVWRVTSILGPRSTLPSEAHVTRVEGRVLTVMSLDRPRPFQIYWRILDDRLEFWWGDHPDWLKPYVVYERKGGTGRPDRGPQRPERECPRRTGGPRWPYRRQNGSDVWSPRVTVRSGPTTNGPWRSNGR